MKRNERDWAGQLISWIQEAIRDGRTIFEDATNDTGIKLKSGKTKFPDILLFTDKTSGIVFNGWELKFPDTAVDDKIMLENALEKAENLKSNSFITWNGSQAIIWKIENEIYSLDSLLKIKEYPAEISINCREDLANPIKYNSNQHLLKSRANEILHDLEVFYKNGQLKEAINISGNIIDSVIKAAQIISPQFQQAIVKEKGRNASFRKKYNNWKIYESSTLKILASSSKQPENLIEEEILAKFTFYNLIGKIIFYLTLSENLSGDLEQLKIENHVNIKQTLDNYYAKAASIDYQAIFKPYFTDVIKFSEIVNRTLFKLIQQFTKFDFRILPTNVIGTILENLVPKTEKQKLGQYFTPETLANLVVFPTFQTINDISFDPTSGTGTFLNSFYQIFKYYEHNNHSQLLNQIWGNDISHFPAILSVINLYKQDVTQTNNFPRVIRNDYFNLNTEELVVFPDSNDYRKQIKLPIPSFDAIASNFPFIQQEDIPNEKLATFFQKKFEKTQQAFLQDGNFKINERADYFTYCIYNSIRFLKDGGILAAITSNAWLGKEYGIQFKKFLLDNFHIKYIIRSSAEHWFSDSKVSTIYFVLEKRICDEPTKFITINFKLKNGFNQNNITKQLKQIESFYAEIDNYANPKNQNWEKDSTFNDLYHKIDGTVKLCIVPKKNLIESLKSQNNWSEFFVSADLFKRFNDCLKKLFPDIINSFRGERTGWNKMFVIPNNKLKDTLIEKEFLIPYVKSSTELHELEFKQNYNYSLFVCSTPLHELKANFPGAYNWIMRFENSTNKNGTKTIKQACSNHKPFWYSLNPKKANIVTTINPYERLFFCFSKKTFAIDQRLIAMTVSKKYDIELIVALLNSVITFLIIEMKGTSRNLGAIDLNANYFKQLHILNPDLLSKIQKDKIKKAFQPIKQRKIEKIFDEIKMLDRINFDRIILKAYGFDENLLNNLYDILISSTLNRVTMIEK